MTKKLRGGLKPLKGKYFTYCQWCKHDGNCILRHYEFLGVKPSDKIDNSPYPGHEDLSWHLSGFQGKTKRAMCTGRIGETNSIFYPLECECGTTISSLTFSSLLGGQFCAKFEPNEKGKERIRLAEEIAKRKGVDISEIDLEEDLPPPDPNYIAIMMH